MYGKLNKDQVKSLEDNNLDHALRDVEFYTRLSDSITSFNNVKNIIPLQLQRTFAKCWVSDISREELKEIFIKELTDLFFKKNKNKNPIYLDSHLMKLSLKEAVSHYTIYFSGAINKAPDSFFELLKTHQFLKYKKAVKEFYKAVNIT